MKVETCDTYCHKEFEKLFDTEYQSVWDEKAGQCEFGAFYIEPMQGTGGYIVPPKGYMKKLAESLKKRNVLLVADEIQMGVYRTGKLWSWENFDIIPDIFVFGKAITNGLNPLSGIWAKEELINPEKFPPGSTHSTFASNPLGTSVALEVLKMTSEDNFEKKVNDRGAYFLKRIEELKSRWKVVGDVSGLGLALRIELCEKDGFTASRKLADRMFNEGLLGDIKIGDKTYGLVLDIGGYEKNVITLAPSLLISEEEIDLGIQLFEALLKRCGAE
jgi:4-aminobutyrate aminotransferase-like enzyme